MVVYHCDGCESVIGNERGLVLRLKWDQIELCPECGQRVIDFLREQKIIAPKMLTQFGKI